MNNKATALIGIFIGLLMVGCGSSKTPTGHGVSADLASRGEEGITDPNALKTECNYMSSNEHDLSAIVATNYRNGAFIADIIELHITQLDPKISDGSEYLQLFKWRNNREFGTGALNLFFTNKTTRARLSTTPVQAISKNTIQTAITQAADNTITMANFFQNYYVEMEGLDLSWDAVSFGIYSSSNNQSQHTTDALLPVFEVHPSKYAASHSGYADLISTHPFYGTESAGYTEEQYAQTFVTACASLQ